MMQKLGHPALSPHAWTLFLLLGTACTIGPRTPIEPPASDYEKSVARTPSQTGREKAAAEDKDFRLPQAERVTDQDEPTSQVISESSEWGLARARVGERPPWASLETHEETQPSIPPRISAPWSLKRSIYVGKGYLHQAAFTADQNSVVTLSTESGDFFHYSLDGKLLRKIALPEFEQFENVEFAVMSEVSNRSQLLLARPGGTSVLDLESGSFNQLSQAIKGQGIASTGRFGLYGVSRRQITTQSGSLHFQWITGDIALELKCQQRPDDWALSGDGKTLAIQYYPANRTEVLNLKNGTLLTSVVSPKWGGSVALSPDASLLALGGEKLVLVRLPGGELVAEDSSYGNNIHDIRFTSSGDALLVSAYDGKARSYALPKDLSTLSRLPKAQELKHRGTANVYALGLSKNERLLVTSSGDQTIKLWQR